MSLNQTKIMAVVREYRRKLKEIFGNQLDNVILYGSFARDEGRKGSDIDILFVLHAPFVYMEAIRKLSHITAEMSIENDVVISRVFVPNEDIQRRKLPFFMNIRREGIPK